MTLSRNEHLMAGGKAVLTNQDLQKVNQFFSISFGLNERELEEKIGLYIEKYTNGIEREFQLIKPATKFFINENEFVSSVDVYEDGQIVVTVEDQFTGEYSCFINPAEWE